MDYRKLSDSEIFGIFIFVLFGGALIGVIITMLFSNSDPHTFSGTVVRVIDGDTYVVGHDGEETTVRIIGVNTPEIYGNVECYGYRAASYAKGLLLGKEVEVKLGVDPQDIYGRTLGNVFTGQKNAAASLLRAGVAEVDTVPPDLEHSRWYRELQEQAFIHRKGMWSVCGG